jgi:putative sterol carrier protein
MSALQTALEKFIDIYHANSQLVSQLSGWDCSIALYASDTDEAITLQMNDGKVVTLAQPLNEVDLLVTTSASVLFDVLELRRDPNEPYIFGELTIQGPEAHFMRLDYVMTMLCPG